MSGSEVFHLGQEPSFLDDDNVEPGRKALGPYGGVYPRRASTNHHQRLLLVLLILLRTTQRLNAIDTNGAPCGCVTYLLVVVDVAGRVGGVRRGGKEAAPPEEGGRRGEARGGESGRERRPWRHFVEQLTYPSWGGGVVNCHKTRAATRRGT